jgi:hypothetical protein
MRNIFIKESLQEQFSRDGYVVVPWLTAEETASLKQQFLDKEKATTKQFYASAHDPDLAWRTKMSEDIKTAFQQPASSTLIDMELLGGSFIVKPPAYEHVLQAHQDWNIVDESHFFSCNIWVPLVDTDKNNGAIMVMPKSHQWIEAYRHSSIPCAFSSVHQLILDTMTTLELKAGEALIYNHALLHASHPNTGDTARIACALGIKPKEAAMLFYFNNQGRIEEYESNPEFFMQENVFAKPSSLILKRSFSYEFPSVSPAEFYAMSGITPPITETEEVEAIPSDSPTLPFWKVYTPGNIAREIIHRLKQ